MGLSSFSLGGPSDNLKLGDGSMLSGGEKVANVHLLLIRNKCACRWPKRIIRREFLVGSSHIKLLNLVDNIC